MAEKLDSNESVSLKKNLIVNSMQVEIIAQSLIKKASFTKTELFDM